MTTFREAFPIMYVDDVDRAARFYVENLGFEQVYGLAYVRDPDGYLLHITAKR